MLVLFALCTMMFTSCAGYNYSQTNDRGQATVTLNQNNFRVVKRVSGEVSCHRLFGIIGGLSDEYLKNSAISKMYENAQLTGSQTIIDIHVVKSNSMKIFFTDEYMIATGTIIEFTGANAIKLTK